ncbi:MAG: methyltransferase domain-containing protein [Flavobacteriaceae bacterium]|nr:MAG: methyltransferase domain-containing protein [Flavobacteriaceae bacterium]
MTKKSEFHYGLTPYLNCKDYLVSNETYEVMISNKYDILVTSPVPLNLNKYYNSKAYTSHTDSKKKLIDYLYQIIKKISIKKKYNLIKGFHTQNKILDIGAGTGDFLHFFKSKGWNVFGIEPNFEARKLAEKKGVYLKETIHSCQKEIFDVVTMWHVLEHVPNLSEYIETLSQIVSNEGILFIAVPNFKSYDAHYYKEYWAAYDVPRHLWHFSQKGIEQLFKKVKMKIVKTYPLKFDSYYVSLLSEKNKTNKQNLFKALLNGWKSNRKARKNSEYSSIIYVIKKQ